MIHGKRIYAGVFREELRESIVDVNTPQGNYYARLKFLISHNKASYAVITKFRSVYEQRTDQETLANLQKN